jgi:hypothetical protein
MLLPLLWYTNIAGLSGTALGVLYIFLLIVVNGIPGIVPHGTISQNPYFYLD